MSFPTYKIRNITDLYEVPPSRLKACLEELETTLLLMHAMPMRCRLDEWTWIDDGDDRQTPTFIEEPKHNAYQDKPRTDREHATN